jgi:membrane protein DedA with SNARE-associated domain
MENYAFEFLPNKQELLLWISKYGPFALFVLFALGIIALPVPEESLMVISGILISQGDLPFVSTVLACIVGSMVGITVSYLIGRTAGHYMLIKYGSWFGLTKERLAQAHEWFESYGKWTLFFGYFIPGVRHFTGIFAGASELSYHHFSFFAYMGALAWASTFLSIGYFFGDYWLSIYEIIESKIEIVVIGLIILAALFLFLKRMRKGPSVQK